MLKDLPGKWETGSFPDGRGKQKALYAANARVLKDMLEEGVYEEAAGKLQILAQLTRPASDLPDPRLYYENYRGDSAKLET